MNAHTLTISKFRYLILPLCFLGITPCSFAGVLNDVKINGFFSQGYLKSDNNNFIKNSEDGTFQYNEAALTLSVRLEEKLHFGMQLLARDFGDEGNNEVRLDWGYADYNYRDWLGLRVGKIKLPIGLHNEGRDSDFLRPMALLPQSVYDENKRNLLVAAKGAGLYGNMNANLLGDFDYSAFYGQIDFPDDSPMLGTLKIAANEFAANLGLGYSATGLSPDNQYVYGAALVYNTPLSGFRISGSYFDGRTNFDVTTDSSVTDTFQVRMRDMIVLSMEYALPRITFTSECISYRLTKNFWGRDFPMYSVGPSLGWYGMATWQITAPLSLSLLYDVFYEDSDDKNGDHFKTQGKPDYLAWRKDFGVGFRYDINFNWLIKVEWHRIDGAALLAPALNPPPPKGDGMQGNWDYWAIKASYNF